MLLGHGNHGQDVHFFESGILLAFASGPGNNLLDRLNLPSVGRTLRHLPL
jgi:hypothetical protein